MDRMMVVDGVRRINRIYPISKGQQEAIAKRWAVIAQVRAAKTVGEGVAEEERGRAAADA